MSLDAISAARKITGITPREKFVLMALADYANDSDEAWPKQSTLADWTCLSLKTVHRALIELERTYGLVSSTQLYRDDGGMRSKQYELHLPPPGHTHWDNERGAFSLPPASERPTPLRQADVPPTSGRRSKNHHKNHQEELNPSSSGDDGDADVPLFGEEVKAWSPASSSPKDPRPASASPKTTSRAKTLTMTDSRFLELLPRIARAWNENCGKLPKLRNDTIPTSYKANTLRMVNEAILDDIDPVEAIAIAAGMVKDIDWYLERGGFGNLVAARNWRKHYDAGARNHKPKVEFRPGDKVTWLRNTSQPGAGTISGTVVSVAESGVVTVMPDRQPNVQVIEQTANPLNLTLVSRASR